MLSFAAMLMPAIACFSKLKRDKRHRYRNDVPTVSQTYVHYLCISPVGSTKRLIAVWLWHRFLGDFYARRMPASWRRFLWFMTCLGIACFSLVAGQG